MTCRRAAELISEDLDTNLPPHQRAGLGFHTLLCGACRRYRRQLGAVEEAVAEFFASAGSGNPAATLPPSSKEHLKAVIGGHLDGHS
jgi:hypothetical protein